MIEERIMKLASTRPDMACIFQVPIKTYPHFIVYRNYIACYTLNRLEKYDTTELKPDVIKLESNDLDLNKKLEDLGYDPEENVIYAFYLENQSR